ncbi:ABC transporter ATP-binding protein [Actinomarinicola tropica]|uniref:ABC-type quaternary amine transporter n=1 Tax=Actinomarinicola tropica TaxID=2789776 RepID=A0A5Q2RJP0_9ACTN|nr:ABC transporter ATP-binding protein [Actinomarinicola tropica]QGG95122.1 ATP-binding cassette domain-containing protein [Actinomarinicola tropica]
MSLRLDRVTVHLGGRDVVRDVSLDVGDREVLAVLGPSGSGKTTVLRVIAGLQAPTSGRVEIDGRDVTAVPTHARGVGMMFQDHALFPHRDVGGNVAFGMRMARASRSATRSRVAEVLDLVGLSGFESRAVDGLSGGERQRVALARALAPRPSLLLLDEPLGSLDRALRDRLLDELAGLLRSAGVTAVHVTHDQAEAFATGERIAVVLDGRLAQVGPPPELWRRPVDLDVARVVGPVGAVPVEVRDGRVVAPWGPLPARTLASPPTADGPATLLVRPDAVELCLDGAEALGIGGTVARRSFRGDHVQLHVAVPTPEGAVDLPVVEHDRLDRDVGERVTLRLRDRSVIVVDPATS